ncbi:DUF3015 family protein [Vibrio caribbeanicus]|uniref:DUF3015 family protein n=1 Tax=Vibrio caribbeanicus TaxID=701175 RepID=UPI0030D7C37A
MKKLTLCAFIASSLLAGNAAAEKKPTINPWTHCGIGAMIFEDNGAAAAISNIIWDLGTTAVSSKISSEDSCKGKEVQTAQFIQDNYNQVIEETSQGSGSHLTAMLDMLDVEQGQQAQVIKTIRADVDADQNSPEAYYNVVMASL